jgi:alpha-tubulin suppressor-like RCC1 family protein
VICGLSYTVAVREDGLVIVWGANYLRQCEIPDPDLYVNTADYRPVIR